MADSPSVDLILVFHNHQPVGNVPEVFRAAFDGCYRPLLDEVIAHPEVRVALHHSGSLFEWLVREEPGYVADLRELVEREQVEAVGGGFYEPILTMLSDEDSRGQIEMMSSFCRTSLGVTPQGLWLAERVWDPDLPRALALAGVQYVLLDDAHFESAGIGGEDELELAGYYVTEKAGASVAVFPIARSLRYAIPFEQPEQVVGRILSVGRGLAERGRSGVLTYGDDGEKIGMWPGTDVLVREPRWLKRFFDLLQDRQDEISTTTPQAVLARHHPLGRVYLPTSTYEEMDAWALPAAAGRRLLEVRDAARAAEPGSALAKALPFLRGGLWSAFLAKYPEANRMHKKMMRVSTKLQEAYAARRGGALYGDPQQIQDHLATAQRALYASQCSCAYWHGWFGGIYFPHLRRAVLERMLDAEALLDRLLQGEEDRASCERVDFDGDLVDEALLSNRQVHAYASAADGGALFAFDDRQRRRALIDVVARREEAYHSELDAEERSRHAAGLRYDDAQRLCFVDRFFACDTSPMALYEGRAEDLGSFAASRYRLVEVAERTDFDQGVEAVQSAEGVVRSAQGEVRLRIAKRILVPRQGAAVQVVYTLTHEEGPPLNCCFAPELNLAVLPGAPERRYLLAGQKRVALERPGAVEGVDEVSLVDADESFSAVLSAEGCRAFWHYPVETLARTDTGLMLTPQGMALYPVYHLELQADDVKDVAVLLGLEALEPSAA